MKKLILYCILTFGFSLNLFAQSELCLYTYYFTYDSGGYPDYVEYPYGIEQVVKLFPEAISGHTFLQVNINNKPYSSYSYWPKLNAIKNKDYFSRSTVLGGTTNEGFKFESHVAKICSLITFEEVERVNNSAREYVNKFGVWSQGNNCVTFSTRIFEEFSGKSLGPTRYKGIKSYPRRMWNNTPKSLYKELVELAIDNKIIFVPSLNGSPFPEGEVLDF